MLFSNCRTDVADSRDWTTLRDLVVRASSTRQCPELGAAISAAPRAADAWRERMAGMCGPRRLTLFVSDDRDAVQGFVSAYLDEDYDARYVIVRHLLVLPTADTIVHTHALLDRTERWAIGQDATEVLLEVESSVSGVPETLASRGYDRTGTVRPSFDSVGGPGESGLVAEWRRPLSAARRRVLADLVAVAS